MKRRGTPTLYELARSTAGGGESSASPTLAIAMRSLRVPLGFLWLLGVAVLLVAIVAYAFGYGRGRSAGFAEGLTQSLGERTAQATTQRVRDPLVQAPAAPAAPATRAEAATTPKAAPAKAAAQGGDPRVAGYWYFTVARPSSAAAPDMLAFCRAEGLDAHLVSDDNGKSRKIIVLPPLMNAEARKTPEGQKLEASIQKAGNRWKAKAKGNKNFSDAYPELFTR